LLIAARDSVQRGKWYDWLKANIKRSIRDCQKAIAVAHAPDPHRKLAEQRKKNRQYARRHRQNLHRRGENIIDLLWSSGAARPAAAAQNAIGLPLPSFGSRLLTSQRTRRHCDGSQTSLKLRRTTWTKPTVVRSRLAFLRPKLSASVCSALT